MTATSELSKISSAEVMATTKIDEERIDDENFLRSVYLGCLRPVEAEKRMKIPNKLALYHKHDRSISAKLYLKMFIVYVTSTGETKHYEIENSRDWNDKVSYRVTKDGTLFRSLGQLARYYSTYFYLKNNAQESLPVTE